MAIYMQSTIELRADGVERFTETMKEVIAIVEPIGWRLVTAVMHVTGRLHTGIDLWEMEDLNTYQLGLATLRGHPRFAAIGKVLSETIERETVVLGVRAGWVPEGR